MAKKLYFSIRHNIYLKRILKIYPISIFTLIITDSTRLSVVHLSPLGSQLSFSNMTRIENVVDWEIIAKKYRTLTRDEPEEPVSKDSDTDTAENESEIVPNNIAMAPP